MLLWKGGVHFLFSCSIATHSCLVLFIRHYLVFMSSFYCIIHVNAWKWIKCSVDIVKCNVNVYQGVPQSVQLKGFSPVWILMCCFRIFFFTKAAVANCTAKCFFSSMKVHYLWGLDCTIYANGSGGGGRVMWKLGFYGDLIVLMVLW